MTTYPHAGIRTETATATGVNIGTRITPLTPSATKAPTHKYTINIPVDLLDELKAKCHAAGFRELAPYLRAVIIKEVREGNFRVDDVFSRREIRKHEWNETCKQEGQRREKEIGFVKLSIRRISDLINPRQEFFKW